MKNSKISFLDTFLKHEASGGILLMFAALLAIIIANTPLGCLYEMLIKTPVAVKIGALEIDKPLLLWVNDGLMAVFFFLVGLELKREFLEGELSNRDSIILPGIGAVGGMALPAIIFIVLNTGDPVALKGWAIPAATDIAFALGVLALLGPGVPLSLKVFLTSVAIFDDIGAILIIAFFYTSRISFYALVVVLVCVVILFILNRRNVLERSPYIFIGVVMWTAMLKSGVHATLAGVILAMFIPNTSTGEEGSSPLKDLEYDLHSAVAYIILPLFAFCNSGISFSGMGVDKILHGVPLGIAAGLFLGKQVGVFGLCWIAVKAGITRLPEGLNWRLLYGVAALCGIGFTMSLFIGSLAFEETGVNMLFDERLGIIMGSLASGIVGYMVLRLSLSSQDV